FDLHVFANHGIAVRGLRDDTMLESYVIEAHKNHALENLADRHLDRKAASYEEVCGKGASQIPFGQLEVSRATEYMGERTEIALQLHGLLAPEIDGNPALQTIYRTIEMPTAQVLQKVERHGVKVDSQALAKQSHEIAERLIALEQEAYGIAEQPFNLGSPKQI